MDGSLRGGGGEKGGGGGRGVKGADVQLGCSFGIYTQMWAPLR